MQDAQGAEFSRFLPLAADEGESQPVGRPCVSIKFVRKVNPPYCLGSPTETSSQEPPQVSEWTTGKPEVIKIAQGSCRPRRGVPPHVWPHRWLAPRNTSIRFSWSNRSLTQATVYLGALESSHRQRQHESELYFKPAAMNRVSLSDFEPHSSLPWSEGIAQGCRPASPGISEKTTLARAPACGTHPSL